MTKTRTKKKIVIEKNKDVKERFRNMFELRLSEYGQDDGGSDNAAILNDVEDFIVQEIDQAIREERERVTAILEERKLTGQFLHDGDVYTPEDINALIGICLQAINQEQ